MARRILFCIALLAMCLTAVSVYADGCCSMCKVLTPGQRMAGWKPLFDGKTLTGWKAGGKAEGWTVENGAIMNTLKGGGMLATVDSNYGDFQLAIDFKMEKATNSGVFFHWTNLGDPVQTGIEMQVLDSAGKATPDKHDCGAMYDCLEPKLDAAKPAGEWNHAVITCKGSIVLIDLNGKRIISANLARWTTAHQNPDGTPNKFDKAYKDMIQPGYIGLQDHGHKVWFKNIMIRTL